MKNSIWLGALLSPLISVFVILTIWVLFIPADQITFSRFFAPGVLFLLPICYAISFVFIVPITWLLQL